MRFAYADPPYPGMAHLYPENQEVDHVALLAQLEAEYDGWALSTHVPGLKALWPLCSEKVRVCVWIKSYVSEGRFSRPVYGWEPVLVKSGRFVRSNIHIWDWHKGPPEPSTTRTVYGQKPDHFSMWMFGLVGAQPGDDFVDLFPGSGAVTRAWEAFQRQQVLAL